MTKGPRLRRTRCALKAHQQHVADDERVHRSVLRPVIVQLAELELLKETRPKLVLYQSTISQRTVKTQEKPHRAGELHADGVASNPSGSMW